MKHSPGFTVVVPSLSSPPEKGSGQSVSVGSRKRGHALIECTRRGMEQRVRGETRKKITSFHAPQETESKASTFFGSQR